MPVRGAHTDANINEVCVHDNKNLSTDHTYLQGGHWGFTDSGYRPIFGAEMRKLHIISANCGYLLHFCGMRIFLQNYYSLLKNRRFDAHSVKILCNIYLKVSKQTKTIHITKI